jgi:hypothetical protein
VSTTPRPAPRISLESPADFVRELERWLRAAAPLDYAAVARRRQTLVFERFLARLAARFGEALTLKGSLVLEYRLDQAPAVRGLELAIASDERPLLTRLREAANLELSDFMAFEVARERAPAADEDTPWSEQHFRVIPKLAGKPYGRAFGVELTLSQPSVGAPELVSGDDLLDFAGVSAPLLRLYPIATHIAETFHAYTLPRTRPNANVSELAELALLASAQTLDARSLKEALRQTFDLRGTHPLPDHVPDPPQAWLAHYAAFARAERVPWADLDAASDAVHRFLDPLLAEDLDATWDPETWSFL